MPSMKTLGLQVHLQFQLLLRFLKVNLRWIQIWNCGSCTNSMYTLSLMEKQSARLRKPTTKYLKLTQDTVKKTVRANFRQLEHKTDLIRGLQRNEAITVNDHYKEWLKLHDLYYKSYNQYLWLLSDDERKKYEDECLINNDWFGNVKMSIEKWFNSNQHSQHVPVIPVKTEKKIEQTNSDEERFSEEVSQPKRQMTKTSEGQKADADAKEVSVIQSTTSSRMTFLVSSHNHADNAKMQKKKEEEDMEKIHVAPLSSKSIPALFAVPNTDKTGGITSMRLCKRIIYIKNGLSYSNYVPVTQIEADAKNMFGIERVVNVLDEKHQFKRHMVIKNWVNHVKPAKGAITAIPSPAAATVPVSERFVQIPVSSSTTPKPESLQQPIKKTPPLSKPDTLQQPIKKTPPLVLIPFSNPVKNHVRSFNSTPEIVLKQRNISKTEIKTNQPANNQDTGKSDIKITSVFSLSKSKAFTESKKNTCQSTVVMMKSNALKNYAVPQTTKRKQSYDSNKYTKEFAAFENIVSLLNNHSPKEGSAKTGLQGTGANVVKVSKVITDNKKLNQSTVYLLMTHKGKQCLVQSKSPDAKDKIMTHSEILKSSKPNEKVTEIVKTISKSKKKKSKRNKSEHRKNRKGKKRKRPKSPSESSSDCDDSTQNDYLKFPVTQTASLQMLKGVERDENKLIVRKSKQLKVTLSKLPSLTNLKTEIESEEETESSEIDELFSPYSEKVVVKEEPLDPSDDSDGYLNSFMKEQQSTLNTKMHQSNENMPFPLVMIKKEPVSDDEDQETTSSKIVKIKEEPVSDQDDHLPHSRKPQCQKMHKQMPTEEEPKDVCSSREDRVKQLREKIKEKQIVLAAFRKRPRISLVDNV